MYKDETPTKYYEDRTSGSLSFTYFLNIFSGYVAALSIGEFIMQKKMVNEKINNQNLNMFWFLFPTTNS